MNDDQSHNALRVSVVGDFQIGKSSLVNCLLTKTLAETGEGFDPTTNSAMVYQFLSDVLIVDTPGFDDTRSELTAKSKEEIRKADVVMFMQTDKTVENRKEEILRLVGGKPLIVLFNCWHKTSGRSGWIPEAQNNVDTCARIRKWLANVGMESSLLPIDGKTVLPINVLWAQFGLGQPLYGDQNEEDIADFARKRLNLNLPDSALRAEMLRRSGFLPVQEFLRNLPLELLKDAATHPDREIDRIVNRFTEELKKRWNAA